MILSQVIIAHGFCHLIGYDHETQEQWKLVSILSPPFLHKNIHSYMVVYGTAKKKRPGYLVGNLVATNWPIEKALHAIGYNQIPTK